MPGARVVLLPGDRFYCRTCKRRLGENDFVLTRDERTTFHEINYHVLSEEVGIGRPSRLMPDMPIIQVKSEEHDVEYYT